MIASYLPRPGSRLCGNRDVPHAPRRAAGTAAGDARKGGVADGHDEWLGLQGWIPASIFPRWSFLLLAANQLVNHLDKTASLGHGGFRTKVIIRTSIGSERPLHPSTSMSVTILRRFGCSAPTSTSLDSTNPRMSLRHIRRPSNAKMDAAHSSWNMETTTVKNTRTILLPNRTQNPQL